MVKLTIIARMDDSGLGHQTRDLVRALKPDKVVAIDFHFYNKFRQHREWYEDYDTTYINGFIADSQAEEIIRESDIVLTAETFYNNRFIDIAIAQGKMTVNQINYEFFEPLANRSLNLPTKILMPSYWHLEEMRKITAVGKVEYLPPPTFVEDYDEIRKENYARTGKKRFLHVAGKMAAHDRAGTRDLLEALQHSNSDFELVIKVQSGEQLQTSDHRVTLDYSFPDDERELYRGFDAMIQPRRYAGLNLPMNEALSSGLPVIMTDISPNNQVLPKAWLVASAQRSSFMARTYIEVYSAYPQLLASKIDEFVGKNDSMMLEDKERASAIAQAEFSPEVFKHKWDLLLAKWGVE